MFTDLAKMVQAQQTEIDAIYSNVEESNEKTKLGLHHIHEANRLQSSGNCLLS